MIDSAKFKLLVREHLVPVLKSYGFKGTGYSFRKDLGNHYIHTLQIQANRYGGSCCIEMGIYIDFIPNVINKIVQKSKVTSYDCVLGKRLSPTGSDYWFEYGQSEKEAISNIQHMKIIFEKYGMNYYNQFQNYPHPLDSITLSEIENGCQRFYDLGAPMGIRLAPVISRVQQNIGNLEEAYRISEWGLKNIGRATFLVQEFESIIREIQL